MRVPGTASSGDSLLNSVIPGKEVKIFKHGKQVILEPIETSWDSLFESLSEFPEDFLKDGRNQPGMQERESF